MGCGVLGTATLTARYLVQMWTTGSVGTAYLDLGLVVAGLLLSKNASYLGYSTAIALYIAEATPQAAKSVLWFLGKLLPAEVKLLPLHG